MLATIKAFLISFGVKKILDSSLKKLGRTLGKLNREKSIFKIESFDIDDSLEFISKHIHDNLAWSSNVSFRDTSNNPKSLLDVFVDLDMFLTPQKLHMDDEVKEQSPSSELLLKDNSSVILLGQPGAGKTTTIKKLFIELYEKENEISESYSFPLIIQLKNLNGRTSSRYMLLEEILNMVGVQVSEIKVPEGEVETVIEYIYESFIDALNPYFIFDGFDEISDDLIKKVIINNLSTLSKKTKCSFVLTSRSADFDYHIDGTNVYEICPLTESQVEEFIKKWFEGSSYVSKTNFDHNTLLSKLKDSPYWDTALRPLTLAHLCALQERNNSIPNKPKDIYRKIVILLLEDWNNQRSIERVTKYGGAIVQRKMEFLARVAFELSVEYTDSKFNSATLEVIYNDICHEFELPKNEGKDVINEIENHTGLIMQTGFDRFEFAHKSLQEFLCADLISKQNELLSETSLVTIIPNEIAIAISLTSFPNITFYKLVITFIQEDEGTILWFKPLIARLLIEKPDFANDALLSMTILIILEKITLEVFNEEQNRSNQSEDAINGLKEFQQLVVKLTGSNVFSKSVHDLKHFYSFSNLEKPYKSKYKTISNLGPLWYLKKNSQKYKIRKKSLSLPEYLILPNSLFANAIVN